METTVIVVSKKLPLSATIMCVASLRHQNTVEYISGFVFVFLAKNSGQKTSGLCENSDIFPKLRSQTEKGELIRKF